VLGRISGRKLWSRSEQRLLRRVIFNWTRHVAISIFPSDNGSSVRKLRRGRNAMLTPTCVPCPRDKRLRIGPRDDRFMRD
jgi:hypothetical protein